MPELNIASCDWNAYITLLRQQDALWARHRDNISLSSYLRCLEDARAVLSLPSWDELSHREAVWPARPAGLSARGGHRQGHVYAGHSRIPAYTYPYP
mgnify:CR=1 FL=1